MEQGMAQGQPGRPPPGHTQRAPRHFVSDAVVFDDYTIAEGRVIPQGAPRTRYHPETCPALPQQLARLARGDTSAVLAFVRTYGLLGYAPLAAAVGRGVLDNDHSPVIENRRSDQRLGRRGESGCALSPYARGCCA